MTFPWLESPVSSPPVLFLIVRLTVLLSVGWFTHWALLRRNPRWRVLLWRGVALGLVLIPVLGLLAPRVPIPVRSTVSPRSPPRNLAEPAPPNSPPAAGSRHGGLETKTEASLTTSASAPEPFRIENRQQIHYGLLLAMVWIAGSAYLAVRALTTHCRFRRILKAARPAPEAAYQKLQEITRDLRCHRTVGLRLSPDVLSPTLVGIFRPVVVLPESMASSTYAGDVPGILAHELAHVQSGDLAGARVIQIVAIALWFHPLMWGVRRAHARACERACDAVAAGYVGDVSAYAAVLSRVALELAGRRAVVGEMPMARRPEILSRLEGLRRHLYTSPVGRWARALFIILGCCTQITLGCVDIVRAFPPGNDPTERQVNGQESSHDSLVQAVIAGKLSMVKELVNTHPELATAMGSRRGKGSSPLPVLHHALHHDHTGIAAFLLEKGADPNRRNYRGEIPIQIAIRKKSLKAIELLLAHGADLGGDTVEKGQPILSWCRDAEVAEYLIAKGADVSQRDRGGATALHHIAGRGDTDVASVLLRHGADVHALHSAGTTPLHWAAPHGHVEMATLLLEKGADINAKTRSGKTPLQMTISEVNFREWELHGGGKRGRKMVGFLLSRGAEYTVQDMIWLGNIPTVKKFLDEDPSLVNASGSHGDHVLFIAAREGHADLVTLLIERGASVNVKDHDGEPLLHVAAHAGHRRVVQVLLARGAAVNEKGPYGELALHWAIARRHGAVVQILLASGSNVNGGTEKHRVDMNGIGPDIDMVAQELSHLEILRMTKPVQTAMPIRLAFATGDTPLHCAAQLGDGSTAKALIAKGAKVDAANKWGETPLHYATVFGKRDVVYELLNAGSDVHAQLPNGMTPRNLARLSGDDGTIKLLEAAGTLPRKERQSEER